MADVQILLGTRNGAKHLDQQLASYTSQTLRSWTLLASDDGSTDGTQEILSQFARWHPGTRLIEGRQAGFASNYLELIRQSDPTVAYLALSDQDDIWSPEKLQRAVDALPPDRPGIYAAQSVLIDDAGRTLHNTRSRAVRPSFGNALVQNILAGNTIVLNRSAADLAVAAMPATAPPFHDWWLYALMAGIGATIICDPKPVLSYRQHASGVLGAHAGVGGRLSRTRMILNSAWRDWLRAHHAALASIAPILLPQHQASLAAVIGASGPFNRLHALYAARARRQALAGTAVLGMATLAGLT